jgi:hypothetical protein
MDFQTTQERQHYSSPGDSHHPLIWPETKKTPVVYKTDKIANLHGHEVLRTPVRHCELNPIELIWVHVKGFVAEISLQYSFSILTTCSSAFVHTSFVIVPKAAYVSSLTSFNRKVVSYNNQTIL